MKTGLVLEGGAMRGMFTAGVLDVLMEHGIVLDGAIGVSAGAVFGCNYKSHQIGRVIRYNTQYCNDKRYASFGNLLRTGNLYSEQFCYHTVPEKLDVFDTKAFAENPMDFFVVCTDVRTGDPIYHKCRTGDAEDIQWMQASASMPLAAKIVKIGHYQLLDGGIADSIPVRFFESIGYKRNLIVLTQPKGFVKKKNNGTESGFFNFVLRRTEMMKLFKKLLICHCSSPSLLGKYNGAQPLFAAQLHRNGPNHAFGIHSKCHQKPHRQFTNNALRHKSIIMMMRQIHDKGIEIHPKPFFCFLNSHATISWSLIITHIIRHRMRRMRIRYRLLCRCRKGGTHRIKHLLIPLIQPVIPVCIRLIQECIQDIHDNRVS